MDSLQAWEEKMQQKRKKTDFRDFVKEICSWSVINLYRNKGKVCRYPDIGRVKNLNNADAQNAASYFVDYDIAYPFFEKYKQLFEKVPLQFLLDFGNNESAEFADAVFGTKNAYLSFVTGFGTENIFYTAFCYLHTSNVFNSFLVVPHCTNIYFSAGIGNSFNIFYSRYINDSANIWFSTNLIGCAECIFCDGLQNQKYSFRNKAYSKEEYFVLKKQILFQKEKFLENYLCIHKIPPKNYLSDNVVGKYIINSHHVENAYWVVNTNSSRNIINIGGDNISHFYDCFDVGVNSDRCYGVNGAGNQSHHLYCASQIDISSHIYYSYFLQNCSFCFGCIGLKNKSYCILNKQYTKEAWYELADKIFSQMDTEGILGDFFPGSLNPFYFNDTMAYLIDDTFTKEEVEREGYMWREEKIKVDIPEGAEIVKTEELKNYQGFDEKGNWQINQEIMKKVIVDEKGNYYKIVPMEYDFLMKHGLPLPEIHWLERIKLGFKLT